MAEEERRRGAAETGGGEFTGEEVTICREGGGVRRVKGWGGVEGGGGCVVSRVAHRPFSPRFIPWSSTPSHDSHLFVLFI